MERDGSFEIMKYFLVLLCGVQLHVGDVGEAGGVQWEVRQDDGDGRVAAESHLQFTKFTIYVVLHRHTVILPELAEVWQRACRQDLHLRLAAARRLDPLQLQRLVHVGLLVSFELVGEWENFTTSLARMLGNVRDIKTVLARQMILQMVLLHKPLVTMLAFELSFRLVSQHVFFQTSALGE